MIRILVISSCTKKKAISSLNQPKCEDISSKQERKEILNNIHVETRKAIEMYQGPQHKGIISGIEKLRRFAEVDFYIISAGFGLLGEEEQIPSYECSFSDMKNKEIFKRSSKLEIMNDFIGVMLKQFDLIYLALGDDYLKSVYDWEKAINSLTIAFTHSENDKVVTLEANNEMVTKLCKYGFKINGTIGFKGDLLRIMGDDISKQKKPTQKLEKILSSRRTLEEYLLKEMLKPKQSKLGNYF